MKSKKNWLQKNLEYMDSAEAKEIREKYKKEIESWATELLEPVMESKEMKEALEKDFKELILRGGIDPLNNEIYTDGKIKVKFTRL